MANPEPLGAGSVMWDVAGELRAFLVIPSTLLLQVMHPVVGAAVSAHSAFRTDQWGRASRTSDSMLRYIYGGELAFAEARRLRELHKPFHGVDEHGRRYHALNGAAYAWVNATLAERYLTSCALFGPELSVRQQERLYADSVQLGHVLGVPGREMPPTLNEFREYFATMISGCLERSAAALAVLSDLRDPPPPPAVPPALWRRPGRILGRAAGFVTAGTLPPEVRDVLKLRWTPADQRRFERFAAGVRTCAPWLPERLRYVPAVRKIRTRAARAGEPRTARAADESGAE
ncbi:oxygenase MpaB family protein [Amycolatopsis nivea]|uniref:oxygenase MpaB family protein n=1 Tax=Amycolatopsis nivea TaxID=1644109 RepID=UPI00142FF0D1|nr:oxygenase MpaB family protein [Amycolatopsis nivea]